MRISVVLMVLGIMQAHANEAYSQKTRLSVNFTETELSKVIDKIEVESEFFFLYNEKLLDTDRKVSINEKDQLITVILDDLFNGTDVKYTIIDRKIILAPEYLTNNTPAVVQQKTVTGTVKEKQTGEPLQGVNILVKGTTVGTITDKDGKFTIPVTANDKQLIVSFIGMIAQEVDIQDNLMISLESDQIGLEEVIVLGYGTRKKRDVIGSVAKVPSSEIVTLNTPSLDARLQGKASGLLVTSQSGTPGSNARVLIRGQHSISSRSEPLWVIDGIIMGSNLDFSILIVNPNDIESVEILKDAAATSIYGQRGSNGVIIITTKSGKSGVKETNIDYSQGISTLTKNPNEYGFANTEQWFDIVETARANSGLIPVEYDPVVHGGVNKYDPTVTLSRDQALATQVNWFDQVLRQGSFKEINLSSSSSSNKLTSFLSANYRDEQSVNINGYLKKFSVRSNVKFNMTDNLSVETKISGIYYIDHYPANGGPPSGNANVANSGFGYALNVEPWNPIYNPDNPSLLWNTYSGRNLIACNDPANYLTEFYNYRVMAAIALVYNIPKIKGLSLRGEATIDYLTKQRISWSNTVVRRVSIYGIDQRDMYRHLSYNLYGIYDRTFGVHNISLVAGFESEESFKTATSMEGDQLSGNLQQLGTPGNALRLSATLGPEVYLRGFFGRGNYKFKNRYQVGFSFRRDGTSEFMPDFRWGTFTAISAGWIISDESFMKGITQINFLKLRGSFGQTGNANVPSGITSPTYQNWMRYGPKAWTIPQGTAISSIAVQDVSWETTNSRDVGIDFGLFKSRISGSFAYYNQLVEDMLLAVPIPISSGLYPVSGEPSIWNNIGDMSNSGFEIDLTTVNLNVKDFNWTTTLNFTTNRAEILKLNPVLDEKGNGLSSGNTLSRSGGMLGTWYLTEFAGIDYNYGYPLIYQADNNIYKLDEAGIPTTELNPNYLHRYVDPVTGENVILPATNANTKTNRILHEAKSGIPKWFGGLTNSLDYKGFELVFSFTFAGGNYIMDNVSASIHKPVGNFLNNLKELSWTEDNRDASLPKLSATSRYNEYDKDGNLVVANQNFTQAQPSDQFLVKGDYVRFRTLSLKYDFQKPIIEKIKLKGLSVYAAANNIWTWTAEFEGFDPEGHSGANNLNQGERSTTLPSVKTLYFGINIKF